MIKLTLTKYRRNISEKGKFKTNEKHGENTGLEAGKKCNIDHTARAVLEKGINTIDKNV